MAPRTWRFRVALRASTSPVCARDRRHARGRYPGRPSASRGRWKTVAGRARASFPRLPPSRGGRLGEQARPNGTARPLLRRHASRPRPKGRQLIRVALEEGRYITCCSTDPGHQSDGHKVRQGARRPGANTTWPGDHPCPVCAAAPTSAGEMPSLIHLASTKGGTPSPASGSLLV